jgi:hypothetical protein
MAQNAMKNAITRGDLVRLLLQARSPAVPPVVNDGQFPDVPQGSPDEKYMLLGQELGIISEYGQLPIDRVAV